VIAGYVGSDPEMRYTPQGMAVSNFTIAINHAKDAPATWFRVAAWGEELASNVATPDNGIVKGAYVKVTGNLHSRQWTDAEGTVKTSLEVNMSAYEIPAPEGEGDGTELGADPPVPAFIPPVAAARIVAPVKAKAAPGRSAYPTKAAPKG
jgi:single-strand DNA-binding protein